MDWKTLILELQESGLSQVEVGARMGKSQAWVSAAACGKYDDLKWRDGQALIELHQLTIDPEARATACNEPRKIEPVAAKERPFDDCGRRVVEARRSDEDRRSPETEQEAA